MTEEIIIDGVDVAGCDGLNKNSLPLKQCDLLQFKTKDGGIAGRWCTDHSNCYYKQLKRLEQENKSLYEAELIEKIKQIALINRLTCGECKHGFKFEQCGYNDILELILQENEG